MELVIIVVLGVYIEIFIPNHFTCKKKTLYHYFQTHSKNNSSSVGPRIFIVE
jgi:hypothetical protein